MARLPSSPSASTAPRSPTRYHFLYTFWKAAGALAAGLVATFGFLFVPVPPIEGVLGELLRYLDEVNAIDAPRAVARASEIWGFDVTGSLADQFAAFLAARGGLLLPAFLVGGGLLAVALEWRYGSLLE